MARRIATTTTERVDTLIDYPLIELETSSARRSTSNVHFTVSRRQPKINAMDVQGRIKAFENKIAQSALAPDLKQFLDMVWTHRAEAATDYYKVYGLYIRERRRFNVNAGVMKAFFDALLTFVMVPEIQCNPANPRDQLGTLLKKQYGATQANS